MTLEKLRKETFSNRIGNVFKVDVDHAKSLDFTLVEVGVLSEASRIPESGRDPFSLVFHGPPQPVLPQGIYRFHRDDLGSMDIFIVPVGPDEAGMRYEAIFT